MPAKGMSAPGVHFRMASRFRRGAICAASVGSVVVVMVGTSYAVVHEYFHRGDAGRVFTRDAAGGWPSEPVVTTVGGSIRLNCIDLDLPIAELYRDTHLEPAISSG